MSYSEHDLQVSCTKFINQNFSDLLFFSVPNEAAAKRWNYFQNAGALRGAPDSVLVVPDKVIFIEFKTEKGTQSEQQKWFQIRSELLHTDYHIVRDLQDFKAILRSNLSIDKWNGVL